MELCHVEEQASCFQYGAKQPSIEVVELKGGNDIQFSSDSNKILFMISGTLNVSGKKVQNKKIKTGESVLIPSQTPCVATAMKDANIVVMRLDFNISFCGNLSLEQLLEQHGKIKKEAHNIGILTPNPKLTHFAHAMQEYVNDGLKCSYFYDVKIREFLFLIRACYDEQKIFEFFKPIYSSNFVFSNNVHKNLEKVKTARELAKLLNYSLSGFEKKFKRIFRSSPYQWMQKQRAKKIYHEIHCTQKTFTEIAFKYGFASPAHFNVFCKLSFGQKPGDIRKELIKRSAALFS